MQTNPIYSIILYKIVVRVHPFASTIIPLIVPIIIVGNPSTKYNKLYYVSSIFNLSCKSTYKA